MSAFWGPLYAAMEAGQYWGMAFAKIALTYLLGLDVELLDRILNVMFLSHRNTRFEMMSKST